MREAGFVLLLGLVLLMVALAAASVRGLRRNPVPTRALQVMLAAIAVWMSSDLLVGWLVPGQPVLGVLVGLKFASVGACQAGFLVLALAMAGTGWSPSRLVRTLLSVPPVLAGLLAGTFAWQHLMLRRAPGRAVEFIWGPAFWVHTAWSYALLALGVLTLLVGAVQLPRRFRRQSVLVAAAPLPAFVLNALMVLDVISRFDTAVDPTAVGLCLGTPMLAFAVLRSDLVVMPPVARSLVLERLPDAVLALSREDRVLDVNHSGIQLVRALGGGPRVIGEPVPAVLVEFARAGEDGARDLCVPRNGREYELSVRDLADGSGHPIGRVLVARDVSAERAGERELRERMSTIDELRRRLTYEVEHDALTGLSNRRRLGASLAAAAASGDRYGVALLDIDRFKSVNDHWGHAVGDEVLMQVGRTLQACQSPDVLVGRWGGEEFVLLLRGDAVDSTRAIAERVRQAAVSTPAVVGDVTVPWSVSIGVTVVAAGTTPEHAVANADRALYGAKRHGRNRVEMVEDSTLRAQVPLVD